MTVLWKLTFSPNLIFSVSIQFRCIFSFLFFLSLLIEFLAASETEGTRLDLQSHCDFFPQMQWCVSYYINRLSAAFAGLYCDSQLAGCHLLRGMAVPFLSKNKSVIGLSSVFLRAVKEPQSPVFPGFLSLISGPCMLLR
ncbi:hypothetical protein CEXT_303151 [Caerostris extrusa]|uniref:Secreted protein n=1 Tax=Caerostris extrusa TaxID=172846 RepID=A0AAV4ME37_CAEEX|nr:hypothetical protein CEXT_303151 [Caerostris extrusa]